jgi:LuxR family maltose regulon positive regulatory protein
MATSHRILSWRADRQLYELDEQDRKQFLPLTGDEEQWVAWLGTISSFSFQGQQGNLTVRKEARSRGDQYWYAYRRVGPRMMKKYLGRTVDLTLARLEEMAAAFSSAALPGAFASHSEPVQGPRLQQRKEAGEERTAVEADASPVRAAPSGPLRDPLLATKLYPPRPRSQSVSRSRLTLRLQQGMAGALTLVSAPAGFGKTTLLAQWLAESGMPVAWLSLETEDNEPVRFFSYLLAALHILHPQVGSVARALLETSATVPLERVLTLLCNDLLERAPGDFALVLDDYQVIENDAIERGMDFLLEHLPPQLHLVLATRVDPPLPLTRLRARGQLLEVRAADLRFDPNEVHTFLHRVMGFDLPGEAVATLERRVEGWIAGLQLAALSLQGRSDVPAFLGAFTGSQRFIFDYLTQEVLARQPAAVQAFLLATSILERLCGPLCDAVTGEPESKARLFALEQANLFVVALDDERHWYRYHHLFAEALRARLQQTDASVVPQLHLRASQWYEQQGSFADAVQHAFAAADIERAADLIERIDIDSWAGLGTQVQGVLGWLARLPEPLVRTRPLLCIVHAVALVFTYQLPEAEERLQMAEECLDGQAPSEQARFLRGHIAAARSLIARFSGDVTRSVTLSQQALALLPDPEQTPGPIARLNAAQAYLVSGEVTTAHERLARELVTALQASENPSMAMRSLTTLAQLQVLQGRLRQAAATFEQAGRVVQGQEDVQAFRGNLSYYFGLAEVQLEWNELEQAERLLSQGMELIEAGLTTEGEVIALGYVTRARLLLARLEYDVALTVLDSFRHLADAHALAPQLITRAETWRAHIQLARGNLKAARTWAEQSGFSLTESELWYMHEREYVTLARVRLAQGREQPSPALLQQIFHFLERLAQDAEAKARGSSVLELLLVQSLALAAQGERKAALSVLARAFSLSEPQGYIRLFVDEGAPMRTLLREARSRRVAPHAVARLLAAFGEPEGGSQAGSSTSASALIEPLTRREREVLLLLAEGATNYEIASRLVVSTGTVKKYVYHLCGKLGVQSRTQALARARTLHLL